MVLQPEAVKGADDAEPAIQMVLEEEVADWEGLYGKKKGFELFRVNSTHNRYIARKFTTVEPYRDLTGVRFYY